MKKKSLFNIVLGTSILMFLFKIFGFVKQAVIAYYFGASALLDSYYVASYFTEGFAHTIFSAIGISSLSIYTYSRVTKGRDESNRVISGVISFVVPLAMIVVILLWLFSDSLAYVLAPSYVQTQHQQLSMMIKATSGLFLLSSICSIQGSVLDSEDQFTITRLQSFFNSLFITLAIYLFSSLLSVYSIVVGDYSAFLGYFLLLAITIRKFAKIRFVKFWEIPEVKKIIILAIPLMLGNGMVELNEMADKIIATNLGVGNVSALSYCHVLAQFVTNVMVVNVGGIIFARFSNYVAENEIGKVKSTLDRSLKTIVYVLIPISVITIVCSTDIVKIVYFRGNFDLQAVQNTSVCLAGYALSFSIIAVRDILTKSMYAYQNTKAPMINGMISIILNIILSIILSYYLGIIGIPLGTSISAVITMLLNMRSIKVNIPELSFAGLWKVFLYSIPAIAAEAALLVFIGRFSMGSLLRFLISAIAGFTVYFAVLVMIGDKEAKNMLLLIGSSIKGAVTQS